MSAGKSRKPITVQNVLSQFFQGLNAEEKIEQYSFFADWEAVVGEALAKRVRPTVIRDGVLWANVANSVWVQHLQLQSPKICDDINRYSGRQVVRSIRFKVGRLRDVPTPKAKETVGSVERVEEVLTAKEEARIESLVAGVEDAELRQRLKRLIYRDFQYKKGKEQENDS